MVRIVMMMVIALMMVSCGTSAQSPLSNTAWQVVSVNGDVLDAPKIPTLSFGDGTIKGDGLCNSYSAEYQINGDALTITPIVATEMACEDVIFNIVERDYFGTLNAVSRYAIVGEELQLFDANDAVIVVLRKTS